MEMVPQSNYSNMGKNTP